MYYFVNIYATTYRYYQCFHTGHNYQIALFVRLIKEFLSTDSAENCVLYQTFSLFVFPSVVFLNYCAN